MKNLLNSDSPFEELNGYQFEVSRFVKTEFIKDKIVLDIGCGFGWTESVFLKSKPKKIIGLDSSDECLKVAKKLKNPLCSFKKGSALELPFKDNSFDTVVSWEVLEHIPKNTENQMFSEIFRVLKPGGNLFMSTQYANPLAKMLDPAWWLAGHRHYSQNDILKYAKNSNFTKIRIYTKGGIFMIISILNMYFSKWVLHRNRLFNSFFIQKTKQEYQKENGIVNIFLYGSKPKI